VSINLLFWPLSVGANQYLASKAKETVFTICFPLKQKTPNPNQISTFILFITLTHRDVLKLVHGRQTEILAQKAKQVENCIYDFLFLSSYKGKRNTKSIQISAPHFIY
jgi:hypothetical protein